MKRLRANGQFCNLMSYEEFGDLGENFTDVSVLDTITNMSIPMDEVITNCNFRNSQLLCEENFRTIFTKEGICFTFNSLNSEDIYTNEYDIIFLFIVF